MKASLYFQLQELEGKVPEFISLEFPWEYAKAVTDFCKEQTSSMSFTVDGASWTYKPYYIEMKKTSKRPRSLLGTRMPGSVHIVEESEVEGYWYYMEQILAFFRGFERFRILDKGGTSAFGLLCDSRIFREGGHPNSAARGLWVLQTSGVETVELEATKNRRYPELFRNRPGELLACD